MLNRTGMTGGRIEYHPMLKLTKEQIERVREFLVDRDLVEESENFRVVCDWHFFEWNSEKKTRRDIIVALCSDGGDAETPCHFLIKTESINSGRSYDVWISVCADQETAGKASTWMDMEVLKPIIALVDDIVEKKEAWTELEIEETLQDGELDRRSQM